MDSDQVMRLVNVIRPLLAGEPPSIQGAVIADLLAIWLAGHFAGDNDATAMMREKMLAALIATARQLVQVNEAEILARE
jgi:hypothetical protein